MTCYLLIHSSDLVFLPVMSDFSEECGRAGESERAGRSGERNGWRNGGGSICALHSSSVMINLLKTKNLPVGSSTVNCCFGSGCPLTLRKGFTNDENHF